MRIKIYLPTRSWCKRYHLAHRSKSATARIAIMINTFKIDLLKLTKSDKLLSKQLYQPVTTIFLITKLKILKYIQRIMHATG